MLRYRVDDLTPKARVRLGVRTLAGHRVATLKLGFRRTNALRAARWRCTLPRGVYVITVYATDQAGNRQATAGSLPLTARRDAATVPPFSRGELSRWRPLGRPRPLTF